MEESAMDEKVSESVTGQHLPKPDRAERDAAFSSGAGRKAVEVPIPMNRRRHKEGLDPTISAPVGTELEAQAREIDDV
jgi:hypothetical protein